MSGSTCLLRWCEIGSLKLFPACLPAKSVLLGHSELAQDRAKEAVDEATWGLPWDVPSFLKKASSVEHPFNHISAILPDEAPAIISTLSMSKLDFCKDKLEKLRQMKKRRDELAPLEKKFKDTLHADVRHVLGNKQLLLLQELGEACKYEDMEIFELIATGCELVGTPTPSGVYRIPSAACCS